MALKLTPMHGIVPAKVRLTYDRLHSLFKDKEFYMVEAAELMGEMFGIPYKTAILRIKDVRKWGGLYTATEEVRRPKTV